MAVTPKRKTINNAEKSASKMKNPTRLTILVGGFLFLLALIIIVPIYRFSSMSAKEHTQAGLLAIQQLDYASAERHLLRAANENDAMAAFILGSMAMDGKGKDNIKNPKKAAELFEKSAQLGYKDGQYMIALLYDRGEGVPEDKEKALDWGLLAAAQGDVDAIYATAVWLERGYKGKPEPLMALSLYEQAASKGHKNAMSSLISIYSSGEANIPQNLKRADYWRSELQKANKTK